MLACVRAGKAEQEEGEARQGVMWACEGMGDERQSRGGIRRTRVSVRGV